MATDKTIKVLYDGNCPMCIFQMTMLTWFDWFNQLEFNTIEEVHKIEEAKSICHDDLISSMHCVSKDGKIFKGARSIRHIILRIPLLFPFAIILWIPGIIYLAEFVYKIIAKNRLVISKFFGCKKNL